MNTKSTIKDILDHCQKRHDNLIFAALLGLKIPNTKELVDKECEEINKYVQSKLK